MVKFQEFAGATAGAIRTHERALALVAHPNSALDVGGDMTRE
jgi:hypothetical protein